MTEHTPTPWRVSGCRMRQLDEHDNYLIEHGDEDTGSPLIAQVYTDSNRLPVKANAEFMVWACNSHDDLLAALETIASAEEPDRVVLTHEGGPAGLGEFECGCYSDSGIYTVHCNQHYDKTIARAAIAKAQSQKTGKAT